MKKIRCLLWFILLGLNLQAQTRVDTTYYDSYGSPKRIRSIKVIRGNKANVVVFNQRGQKTESFTLVDNKKNGKYTTYTASGTAISIVNFYNDLKHGEEVLFFNNGKKKSSIEYVANNPLGKFKFWNEAGVLIQKGSYDTLIKVFANRPNEASKVLSGKYESYFQNGKKEKESYYVKGKLNGLSKEWYPSGKPKYNVEYKNGLVYGKEIAWFENGNKSKETEVYQQENNKGNYVKPLLNGNQFHYYENGKLRLVQPYKDFLPHGKWVEYSNSGKLISERNYQAGQLIGADIAYYDNGNMREKTPYQLFTIKGRDTSLMHGLQQSFFENGAVIRDMNYVQGIPYGLLTMYFENGAIERQLFVFGSLDNYALLSEYSKEGKLHKEGTYVQNEKDSMRFKKLIFASYYSDGTLQYRTKHQDAKAIKQFESYYENGNLLSEAYIFKWGNDEYLYTEGLGTAWQAIYYPNGALRYELLSVNNFRHGQFMEWFPDGNLKRFIDLAGLDIQWLQDGSLMTYHVYNNFNNLHRDTVLAESWLNQLYASLNASPKKQMRILKQADGIQQSYYTTGKKHMETFVRGGEFDKYFLVYNYAGDTLVYMELQNGLLHGKYLVNNVNGTLHTSGFYKEGKEVGEWKIHGIRGLPQRYYAYDENPQQEKQFTYEFTFYETGAIEKKSFFKAGKLTDWAISYHPNGTIKDSLFFMNDTLHGKYVDYTDEGKLYALKYYEKGKRVGLNQDWYYKTDGKGLMREEFYVADKRHGLAKYYHTNGSLQLLAYYKNGIEDSTWVYYDTTGAISQTVFYENGKKKEVPLEGKCACKDKSPSKGYAQALSSLLSDETDTRLWEFPFHESIVPLLDQCYFKNLQNSNSQRSTYFSFDLITFRPLQIGIPNKSGMKLWLNPCLREGEESNLDFSINITQKKPQETRVDIGSDRLAYILPARIFKPIGVNQKQVLAYFKVPYLSYTVEGINFENATSICMDDAYVLSKNYVLKIDTFSVLNVDPNPRHSEMRYLTFFGYHLLGRDIEKALGNDPILMHNGKGTMRLMQANKPVQAKVSELLLANKVIAGFLTIENVQVKDASLFYMDGNTKIGLDEKALYQQMKQDGFSKVIGQYNPERKVLEILFYIHKP